MKNSNQLIDIEMMNYQRKNFMPNVKSSLFFEELYSHPIFGWRVPPFPLMGNDLENLIRLDIINKSPERRIVNLEAGSGSILLRLLREFPNRDIIGIEEKQGLYIDTNNALRESGYKEVVHEGSITSPNFKEDDIIVTAMNVINLEILIQFLLESNFKGDLISYRFSTPGPDPYKIYEHGTYKWFHHKFDENLKIINWRKPTLALVLGTQRYITIHTSVLCNRDVDNLNVRVSSELKNLVDVKIARKSITSGGRTSVELAFEAKGPHNRRFISGTIEIYDETKPESGSTLNILLSMIPMVEPGLARWIDPEEISLAYLEKFLSEENIHVVSNWASSGMEPPYDYY